MKRRWRLWLILALLLLGGSLLVPAIHWRLIGWAKGEASYQGRPTSYWRLECEKWHVSPCGLRIYLWAWQPSHCEQVLDNILGIKLGSPARLPLFSGEVECVPVLLELLETQNDDFKLIACQGLEKIGKPADEAVPILLRLIREKDPFSSCAWDALYRIDPEMAEANPP